MEYKVPKRFVLSPLEGLVLLHHVLKSKDNDCDAIHPAERIVSSLDRHDGKVFRDTLESALFCCNMEHERGKFWHPQNKSFTLFVSEVLPPYLTFDLYYNVIRVKKKEDKKGVP